MTPEQQLEKLLNDLAEIEKHSVLPVPNDSQYPMMLLSEETWVRWQDIEAILKQTFPDDEFH